MENQVSFLQGIINNFPAIITGLTAILTAAVTGFFTWFITKKQFEIKRYEIAGQTKLRAREHLFNAYRKKLEYRNRMFEKYNNELGEFYGKAMASGDNDKTFMLKTMIEFFRKYLDMTDGPDEYYRKELIKSNLLNKDYEEKLNEIVKVVKEIKIKKTQDSELEEDYLRLLKYIGLISSIDNDLIETKSEELFREFIN